MMIVVPKTNNIDNIDENKKLFTIQYTKEELDKITFYFVTQMNNYIARVNNRIIKTIEEIEKEEVEIVPSTITMIESEEQQKEEKVLQ